MHRSLLLLALAGSLVACEGEPASPQDDGTVTPEAAERYRTGVTVTLYEVDTEIAALEGAAAQADSAGALAYAQNLDALRRERQAIQAALDNLRDLPVGAFGEATASIDARIDEFEERVRDTPLVLAQSPEQLRQAAATRAAAFDAEWQEVRVAAPSAEAQQALAALQQQRLQLDAALGRLGAPDVSAAEIRTYVVDLFGRLFDALDDVRARVEAAQEPAAAPAAN